MVIQIDALYVLLLAESSLIMLVASLYLFSQRRKYKRLYEKNLTRDVEGPKAPPVEQEAPQPGAHDSSDEAADMPEQAAAAQRATEEAGMQSENPEPAVSDVSFDAVQAEGAAPQGEDELGMADDGTAEGRIDRLRRMVILQKNTILELMCYKDIFESAQKKLAALQQANGELQEKIRGMAEAGVVENVGIAEPLSAFEHNSHELEKFIGMLDRENAMLAEKFRTWEEEFRRIAADVGGDSGSAGIDEGKYSELVQEKEDLVKQLSGYEERLKEQTKQLADIQQQYEDLEKEYMILYRQQQQQQQQQQQ